MKIAQRFQNAVQAFSKTNNGILSGKGLARDFLANGTRNMKGNWSTIRLSDSDMYRGYPYAAITLRAKTVARLGEKVLVTDYKEGSVKKGDSTEHPYLRAINESTNFDNNRFWYDNSRYIDMKGVRHIAMLRGMTDDGTVGEPMDVFALNPYRVQEVVNEADGEIGGYIEYKTNGMQRIWEPHQIVRAAELHPITEDPFGMIEAAKDAQFTLKQAGDFTRSSLNANENAPGIISTKIVLTSEQFANFKKGIKNSDKGQPIITNGGQVDWQSMNIDLDKSALDKINEIQRSELFAVSGQSKTSMGIEESGTTRDTSEVQDEKLIRDQAIPTIQLFASALNLDYRKRYPKDYERYGWNIRVEDPTAKNLESDKQAIEIRGSEFDLADKLIAAGYDPILASKYAQGEITLEQLGLPKNERRDAPVAPEPVETQSFNIAPAINVPETKAPNVTVNSPDIKVEAPVVNIDNSKPVEIDGVKEEHSHNATDEDMAYIYNQLEVADNNIIQQSQGSLVNGIVNIDSRLVTYATNAVQNQAFENEEDIVTKQQKEEARRELEFLLLGFYTTLFGLYGRSFMQKRASDIGQLAEFKMSRPVTDWIKFSATEASKSHVNTVTKEMHKAIQDAYNEATDIAYKALIDSGETASKALYEQARRQALEGAGRQQIISALKAAQTDISTKRATTIARNETRRAFTQTQFQADTQFLNENGFMERAEKRWKTNGPNPCPICLQQEARGWVPFQENFIDKGETITYDQTNAKGETVTKTVLMDYENIDAGVAHPNCFCSYELRVRSEEDA